MQTGREEIQGVSEQSEAAEAESEIGETIVEVVEETEEPPQQPKEQKQESPRQTVERVLGEERAKIEKEKQGATQSKQKRTSRAAPSQVDSSYLKPPQRFTAARKEMFSRLPDDLKASLHETIRDLEATTTRNNQELSRASAEARGYLEAVQPYLQEWGSRGLSGPAAIAALATAQARLTDPQTRMQAVRELLQDLQVDPRSLLEEKGGAGAAEADIYNHPQFRALQEQVNALSLVHQQSQQQKVGQIADGIVAEIQAARDEQDGSGRYLYPELHDAAFLKQVQPLVSALVGATPNLSYAEAFKRATLMTRTGTPQAVQTSFPKVQQQPSPNGAASVRGRSAPVASGHAINSKDVPRGARDTVAWAISQIRAGRQL